jgi:hypothetical protein
MSDSAKGPLLVQRTVTIFDGKESIQQHAIVNLQSLTGD